MAIRWDEKLSSGNREVDAQHKELLRRLNLFLEGCDSGGGGDQLVGILQFLDDYIHYHFQAEEQLQEELHISSRTAHRERHRRFESDFTTFKRRFLLEGAHPSLIADMKHFLVNWLLHHIMDEDAVFGAGATEGGNGR